MKQDIEKEFNEAVAAHTDALFRYCYFKIKDRDIAKDLVQDTFMKTWKYLRDGNSIDNIRAFFYRTLGNLIIDQYRKKKAVPLEEMEEAEYSLGQNDMDAHMDKLDGEIALKLLDHIGESYKDVIMMRYVQDLSIKEISDILGESENAVSVKIHRGLKKVKEIFKEHEQ